jgi:diguanylate cyclase (GGDEF)-like protein
MIEGRFAPGLALVLLGLGYILPTALCHRLCEPDSPHRMATMAGDMLLITAIVWATGGSSSEYYLLYYLPIAFAAMDLNVRDGIAGAVLAGTLYAFVTLLEEPGTVVVTSSVFRVSAVCISAAIMVLLLALLKRETSMRDSLRLALRDSLRRIAAVYDVAHAANTGADLGAVLSILLEHAARATGARGGAISILDPDRQLKPVTSLSPAGGEKTIPVDWDSEMAQRALATSSPVTSRPHRLPSSELVTTVYVPLITPTGPLGILGLAFPGGRRFGRSQADFLKTICSEAALAVENAQLRTELRRLAITDSLTGVSSRREAHRRLADELSRAARYSRSLAVLMCDVDNLKAVNDSCGHAAGDQVLSILGKVFKAAMRTYDVAGRIGGDEFLIVLPESDAESALALANRLIEALANVLREADICKESIPATGLSIGVAAADHGEASATELISRADTALYRAKRAGKNRALVAMPASRLAAATAPARPQLTR